MKPERWLKTIAAIAEQSHVEERGFIPVHPSGADVHGSWAWTCVRQESGLVRFVTLSVTEVDGDQRLRLEVEAGIDTEAGFRREAIATHTTSASSDGVGDLVFGQLALDFERGMQIAEAMRPKDLIVRENVATTRRSH